MRLLRSTLASCFLGLWLLLPVGADTLVRGTDLRLQPPPGLEESDRFPGFALESSQASIMVTQLPTPPEAIIAGFTAEALLTRGMVLEEQEEIEFSGNAALFVRATQVVQGLEFEKLILILGDSGRTALVVASYPSQIASQMRAPMRESLRSATWENAQEGVNLEGLPFSIEESENFSIYQRFSDALLLTKDGAVPPLPQEAPFIVVAPSFVEISETDVAELALSKLQTKDYESYALLLEETLEIAVLPAYEIQASAVDVMSGNAVGLYQLLILDRPGKRYFRILAQTAPEELAQWLPQLRQVARSLRPQAE